MKRPFPLALLLALLLGGCLGGGGTDVGNPDILSARVSGALRQSDGTPAAWVDLRLRPSDYVPGPGGLPPATVGDSLQDGRTDSQGFFTFEKVPRGEYVLEAHDGRRKGTLITFTVTGADPRIDLPPAGLDTTGTLHGTVALAGGPDSTVLRVEVLGLERYTLANDVGEFVLEDLPAGTYALRFSAATGPARPVLVPGIRLPSGGRVQVPPVVLERGP